MLKWNKLWKWNRKKLYKFEFIKMYKFKNIIIYIYYKIYILQNIFYFRTARKWKQKIWTSCVPYFRLICCYLAPSPFLPCALTLHGLELRALACSLALDSGRFKLICGHQGAAINMRETPGSSGRHGMSALEILKTRNYFLVHLTAFEFEPV